MNILVTYNGSVLSKIALRSAIRKVREHGGKVIILLVWEKKLFIHSESGARAEVIPEGELVRCSKDIREIVKSEGSPVEWRMVTSSAAVKDDIVRCAEQESIDIIFSARFYNTVTDRITCALFKDLHESINAPAEL